MMLALCLSAGIALPSYAAPTDVSLSLTIPDNAQPINTVVFKVPQHANVHLQVTSAVAGELHFHAYHLSLSLKENDVQTLNFVAKSSGKFKIQWHPHPAVSSAASSATHSHAPPLASLEVLPP